MKASPELPCHRYLLMHGAWIQRSKFLADHRVHLERSLGPSARCENPVSTTALKIITILVMMMMMMRMMMTMSGMVMGMVVVVLVLLLLLS